jgi:hypothetical protein
MPMLSTYDRTLLRTALKAAQHGDVPSVGIRTDTLERLLAYVATLEAGAGILAEDRLFAPAEGVADANGDQTR